MIYNIKTYKFSRFCYLLFCLFLCLPSLKAQVQLKGATCILPGVAYQYEMSAPCKSEESIRVCIEGGLIMVTSDSCYVGKWPPYIRVVWFENAKKYSIAIVNSACSEYFPINVMKELKGGQISSDNKLQPVTKLELARTIVCTEASGGSCDNQFKYQWEISDDNLHWVEIRGADSKDFIIKETYKQSTFLRRKVIETVSNSIAYSDVAIIAITNPLDKN